MKITKLQSDSMTETTKVEKKEMLPSINGLFH